MKLKATSNKPREFTMSDMKCGDVGELISNGYSGIIVLAVGSKGQPVKTGGVVVALNSEHGEYWSTMLDKNSLKVKLFEPGSTLEFEV
jgi:hypothetical protein